jgi:hypothetical protein
MISFDDSILTRFWSRLAGWALLMAVALLTVGCRKVPPAETKISTKPGEANTTTNLDNEDDASRFLSSVVNLLRGEIDPGTYTSAIIQLNKFVQRRPGAIPDLSSDDRAQVARVLGVGNVGIAQRKTFAEDDIEYLRNAFFIRQIARRLYGSNSSKIEHASRLFDWVCDEVSLTTPGEFPSVPPVETLIRGFGDPQERMAIFIELLRQSDLQGAVVAATTKDDPQGLTPWLIGIIDNSDIYLFDPVVGRAVLSPADPNRPATLAELATDPTIATRDYGGSHPLIDAAKIDRFALLLSVEACQLAPRMQFLEGKLVGDDRVSLYLDLHARVKQAGEIIRPISNQAGVQTWRFPEETTRSYVAMKRESSEALFRWQQVRHRPRLADLAGRPEDAIKEIVTLDLAPVAPVVWELSIQSLKLPVPESRRLIAHAMHSVPYVGACAQRSSHPDDPSYSDEWLDRYFSRALSPKIDPADIFEVTILGRQLAGHDDRPRQPLEERFFSLLPENVQRLARTAAANLERAAIVPAPAAEARPTVSVPEPITSAETAEIVRRLNELLDRSDLIDASLAENLISKWPPAARPTVLSKDPSTLDANEVRWRNRLLFDRVFAESIVPIDQPWLAGAVRMRAENLIMKGAKKEAITTLETIYPALTTLPASSLRADAARCKAP